MNRTVLTALRGTQKSTGREGKGCVSRNKHARGFYQNQHYAEHISELLRDHAL
jgi:hypothetical protein